METDEVFVLLEGSAYLTIGLEMTRVDLEPNKIYNVKKGVWHSHIMSPDAKVLIVENSNTSAANSEKLPLSELGK
jgi:mannose-6-phosphate isomerase-like protein (cupin superfamily)